MLELSDMRRNSFVNNFLQLLQGSLSEDKFSVVLVHPGNIFVGKEIQKVRGKIGIFFVVFIL